MSSSQFLSFKGVKRYSPDQGWQQLSDAIHNLQQRVEPVGDQQIVIPVLQEILHRVDAQTSQASTNETWQLVAAQVNELNDCLSAQRIYQERMKSLSIDIERLRESIQKNLAQMSQDMMSDQL